MYPLKFTQISNLQTGAKVQESCARPESSAEAGGLEEEDLMGLFDATDAGQDPQEAISASSNRSARQSRRHSDSGNDLSVSCLGDATSRRQMQH